MPISIQSFLSKGIQKNYEKFYTLSFSYQLCGALDSIILKHALNTLVKKNYLFSSVYDVNKKKLVTKQVVIDDIFFNINLTPAQNILEVIEHLEYDGIDLSVSPPCCFYLIACSTEKKFYLILKFHHLVIDATFFNKFKQELSTLYIKIKQSGLDILTDNSISKKDFNNAVFHERLIVDSNYQRKAKDYWKACINDFHLMYAYKDSINTDNYFAECFDFSLDEHVTLAIKKLAKEYKTCLFILLASVYGVALTYFYQTKKILFRYSIDTRLPKFKHTHGCFVNNLIFKIDLNVYNSLKKLTQNLHQQRKESRPHQLYPFNYIIKDLELKNVSNPFNISFTQTDLNYTPVTFSDVSVKSIIRPWNPFTTVDLGLQYDNVESNQLHFRVVYRNSLFLKKDINDFVCFFNKIIQISLKHFELFDIHTI